MAGNLRIACAALACAAGIASAGVYDLNFAWYTGNVDPNVVPGTTFTVTATTNQADGWVDFRFAVDIGGPGIITEIWFEGNFVGLTGGTFQAQSSGVSFVFDETPSTPAGAGSIDWDDSLANAFRARAGGVNNGINAGEFLTIRFDANSDFFSEGLALLLSSTSRIAFHLQQIGEGGSGSAHYITTPIPLPLGGAMAGVCLSAYAVRRRR